MSVTVQFNIFKDWVDNFEAFIGQIRFSLSVSFGLAATLFALIFILIQTSIVINFKKSVLEMRKGVYEFDMGSHASYDSLSMIGAFIANSFFSLKLFFFFLGIVISPFCFPQFWMLIWFLRDIWINVVVLIVVKAVIKIILSKVLTDGTHFMFRVLYQIYEFFQILTGFVISFVLGLVRYITLVVAVFISLFRIDTSVIPIWVSKMIFFNLDFINRYYFGFMKCYHAHNHPIVHAFAMMYKGGLFGASDGISNEPELTPKQRKIAFKWQLFVLLAMNPSLVQYRKTNLARMEEINEDLKEKHTLDKNFYNKKNLMKDAVFNDSDTLRIIKK